MSRPSLSRRAFTLGTLSATTAVAACGNPVGGNGAANIDARVDATMNEMFRQFPNTRTLSQNASGLLVMPLVTEAGFWFGGAFGRGALRVNDTTVDYYSTAKASAGPQIGAQQYTHVLFFMTQDALGGFRRSSGWAAGADLEYVVREQGDSLATDTTQLTSPVLAAIFGQAGLRVGATLEGTKYTRILP